MVLRLPQSFYPMNKLIGTRYSVDFEGNAGISSPQIHVNCSNNILKVWRPEKMIPHKEDNSSNELTFKEKFQA